MNVAEMRHRVTEALNEQRQLTKHQLWKVIQWRKNMKEHLDAYLLLLMKEGYVVGEIKKPGPKGGRTTTIYRLLKRIPSYVEDEGL